MKYKVLILNEVDKFIDKLPLKMGAKIDRTIELLKQFGYQLPMPHSKQLVESDNLKELRIKHGGDICRLFYFHYKNNTYVITSGYIKKEDKTSKKEINKALSIMNTLLEEIK